MDSEALSGRNRSQISKEMKTETYRQESFNTVNPDPPPPGGDDSDTDEEEKGGTGGG